MSLFSHAALGINSTHSLFSHAAPINGTQQGWQDEEVNGGTAYAQQMAATKAEVNGNSSNARMPAADGVSNNDSRVTANSSVVDATAVVLSPVEMQQEIVELKQQLGTVKHQIWQQMGQMLVQALQEQSEEKDRQIAYLLQQQALMRDEMEQLRQELYYALLVRSG